MSRYWPKLTAKLTREIERDGWRVLHTKLAANTVGSCDYKRRTIHLNDPDPREEFVTLCHENGHRMAYKLHGSKSEPDFVRQCPVREFRETQALVLGWQTCRRYTNRISLRTWIALNKL